MNNNYGLYVHIPFCVQKCPYCGFYSEVGAESYMDAYFGALLGELRSLPLLELNIDTIYIGGGTPSFAGKRLTDFIAKMVELVNYSGDEFTIELNPESVNAKPAGLIELCAALKDTPVNRISMGVQSLSNSVLKLLGRPHDAAQALHAYDMIRKSLSVGVNLDIIYDIPSVDWISINDSLSKLIQLAPEHISAYSYSPDTGYLSDRVSDDSTQMEQVLAMLEHAGYARYEVSNFARVGKASKHNRKYWRMDEYIGIGASAHSMIYQDGRRVRYNHRADLRHYIDNPLKENVETYDYAEMLKESVVFGLRMTEGVKLDEISARHSYAFEDSFLTKIEELVQENLLERVGGQLRCTHKGMLLLNSVMNYLW